MAASNPSLQAEEPSDGATANPLSGVLQGLLKWGTLLLTLGGLALHVAGYIYHAEYARGWGLDADIFPKSIEWILISGYMIMANGIAELWMLIIKNGAVFCLWAFATGTATALSVLWGRKTGQRDFAPHIWLLQKFKFMPESFRIFLFSYLYVGIITFGIVVAPLLAFIFLYLPATLAEKLAHAEIQSEQTGYALGCEHKDQTARCITVRRIDKPDLTGFLIDSSEKHLALYLPAQKQVQVIERDGVEILVGWARGKT